MSCFVDWIFKIQLALIPYMAMNPLPPQAFTKDTLQKAYQWLLQQNASIKDLATSQDVLVSLFLKAQRDGHSSLETPTIQNFKQELKSLVNLMGDLQGSQGSSSAVGSTGSGSGSAPQTSNGSNGLGATFNSSNPQQAGSASSSAQNLGLHLDPQSLSAIAEIRANLNLGSDTESLRALISIGYKHLKKI